MRPLDLGAALKADPLLGDLAERAGRAGLEIAVVGGLPRDLLLRRTPKDTDFVLAGPPDAGEALLARLAADLGVRVLVFDHKGIRERRLPLPGRDLDFVLTDPAGLSEELRRRDFTINAIAVRMRDGEVIDPFGGRDDLKQERLRQVSPEAFRHDPLRLLRAVRFLTEGVVKVVDTATSADIRRHAPRLPEIAGERIREEMDRLAVSSRFGFALDRLRDFDLLQPLAPECHELIGVTQNAFHHLDVWEHTVEAVRLAGGMGEIAGGVETPVAEDLMVLNYALLFHDLGKPATRGVDEEGLVHFYGHERASAQRGAAIARRWRFSNRRTQRIVALVRHHLRIGAVGVEATERALRRLVHDAGTDLELLLLLTLADTGAARGRDWESRLARTRATCARLRDIADRLGEEVMNPVPLLDGRDVMKLLSLAPGPEVGAVLADLLRLQVEGSIRTRAEAEAAILARRPSTPVKKPRRR